MLVIDTSALVAIVHKEQAFDQLLAAAFESEGLIPAPVLVEFARVVAGPGNVLPAPIAQFLIDLTDAGVTVLPFTAAAAQAAAYANPRYGSGNGRGGPLNMLDLMVYAVARTENLPILCTGRDFAATDAILHPASRRT